MASYEQPRVGIGVILRRPSDGRVLLGLRAGSHGAGECVRAAPDLNVC